MYTNFEKHIENEIWKSILNASGYEVSNFGRVRSLIHKKGSIYKKEDYPLILKQSINRKGYLTVTIRDNECSNLTILVHRVECIAFLENTNDLEQINHKDGNKLNNELSNLEWISNLENMRHSYRIGLREESSKGENNGRSILKKEQVLYIYKNIDNINCIELSKIFKVSISTIRNIYKGKIWSNITNSIDKNYITSRKHRGIKYEN